MAYIPYNKNFPDLIYFFKFNLSDILEKFLTKSFPCFKKQKKRGKLRLGI